MIDGDLDDLPENDSFRGREISARRFKAVLEDALNGWTKVVLQQRVELHVEFVVEKECLCERERVAGSTLKRAYLLHAFDFEQMLDGVVNALEKT